MPDLLIIYNYKKTVNFQKRGYNHRIYIGIIIYLPYKSKGYDIFEYHIFTKVKTIKSKGDFFMLQNQEWESFKGRLWKEECNVRDFIQNNFTQYNGRY